MPFSNLNLNPKQQNVIVEGGGDGGGGQTADPATAGAQKTVTKSANADKILPVGAYYLDIQVTDFNGSVSINGQELRYGGQYHREAKFNPVSNRMDFVAETIIVSSGTNYIFTASYPSDSSVDESTL